MPDALARQRTLATLLLLVAAASWGVNWVAARAITLEVPPFALSFWRWAIASALLLCFAAAQLREDAPLILRHLPALVAFGVIGAGGFTLLGYWGVRYTTAINATLLNSSLPLFVVPLSWWLLKLTVSGRQLAGLALSLAGVATIISAGELQTLARLSLNPGDLLLLGGALLWAIYTVLLKWRPPLRPLSFLFAVVAAAAAFSLPFYLWEIWAGSTMTLSPGTIEGGSGSAEGARRRLPRRKGNARRAGLSPHGRSTPVDRSAGLPADSQSRPGRLQRLGRRRRLPRRISRAQGRNGRARNRAHLRRGARRGSLA